MRLFLGILLVGLWSALMGLSALAGDLSDPTRPPNRQPLRAKKAPVTGAPDWRLTMTRISPQERVAVVNGQVVRPGDRLKGARVLAVGPESVVLERDGRRHRVGLVGRSVKRRVAAPRDRWGP